MRKRTSIKDNYRLKFESTTTCKIRIITEPPMLRAYRELLTNGLLKHDPCQLETVKKFDTLQKSIKRISKTSTYVWDRWIFNKNAAIVKQSTNNTPENIKQESNNLYVYGGVGTGKTMLMDMFIETSTFKNQCIRSHWNSFLMALHHEIHCIKMAQLDTDQSNEYIMDAVSQKLVSKANVLCLDEVQQADPASAVLLTTLFELLISKGCAIVCTSNRSPTDLLSTVAFDQNMYGECDTKKLDLTTLISKQFCIYRVKSMVDHRHDNLPVDLSGSNEKFNKIKTYYHLSKSTNLADREEHPINSIVMRHYDSYCTKILTVNSGRKLKLGRSYENLGGPFENVLLLDATSDFLDSNMCPTDYIAMCSFYQAIFIEGLPVLYPFICGDAVRRFISFLDTAYDCRTKIFISSEVSLNDLICMKSNVNNNFVESSTHSSQNDEVFSIERAISRLNEMQTIKYLALPHIPCRFDIFDEDNKKFKGEENIPTFSRENIRKSLSNYFQNE